ncbi:hypothetical protein L1987_78290 [Smallanthus sonchifolius]|uniref:Uncharacterized protein n=1 Tax=Smallanthus sonchifolius TaxID=185202 RepID=A0ACB8ZDB7_9ASTR|nr:hypothetical protein L1987_78290 [Smallanthus sonchifolius]
MLCTTGLPSDVVVDVDDTTFHLHKIPRNSVCIARSFAASSVGLLLLENGEKRLLALPKEGQTCIMSFYTREGTGSGSGQRPLG